MHIYKFHNVIHMSQNNPKKYILKYDNINRISVTIIKRGKNSELPGIVQMKNKLKGIHSCS